MVKKQAQKLLSPPAFSQAAYRVSIRGPEDLKNPQIWPLPQGTWRVVQLDTNGVRIARPVDANEPFNALAKGVVRGDSSMTWAQYAKAIKAAFADPARGLREYVFVATGDYGDVLAPPAAAPVQTVQPTPAEVATKKATAAKPSVPKASNMTVADFAAADNPTGDFDTGEEVEDDSTMLLVVGAGALAALLILLNRGE